MKVTIRRSGSGGGFFAGVGCLIVLGWLAFLGFIIYAIIHFIIKYW